MNANLLNWGYMRKEGEHTYSVSSASVILQLLSLAFTKCAQKKKHFVSRGTKQYMSITFFF